MGAKKKSNRGRNQGSPKHDPWSWGLVGGAILAIGAVVILGVVGKDKKNESQAPNVNASSELAANKAPAFDVVDARSGRIVTNKDYQGRKMLLFFHEGVSCQACITQITALEKKTKEMNKRKISLLSISADPEDALKQAGKDFNVKRTPLLADEDRTMLTDYDMLGKGGMEHADRGGHAFMLVDPKGKILWEQAYQEMFVEPNDLFDDMPRS